MADRLPLGWQGRLTRAVPIVLVACIVAGLILLSWTGYTESDDRAYAEAAAQWIASFPFLGTDHHALRHAIVLPTALFFWLLGPSELGLILPILLYLTATLTIVFMAVSAVAGRLAGLFALLLTGTMPALVLGATVSFTDIPETFFVVSSVWAFYFACRDRRVGLFVLSGALAGLGFVTRETSVAILVLYGILFLHGYGGYRLGYVWMGVGFGLTAGLDFGALWAASGDPLYRFHVSLMGVEADSPLMQDQFRTAPGVDRFGALAVSRGLKPLVVAFLNQQFGLLFWFAVPAAILAARRGPSVARLLGGAALVWFAVLFYGMADYLNVIARYIDVAAVAMAVPLAILLAGHWRARWAKASLTAILIVNILSIAGSDTKPLFGEKALVGFVRERRELIVADPGTFQGAALLLEWEGLLGRVAKHPPEAGELYLFDSRPRRGIPAGWPVQRPGAGWQELARQEKPTKPLAYLARALGVRRYLPSGIADKLDPPPIFVVLYRVR
jgi:4-amino-4-deoxy-L-arabinose transferase-like glycosyltransferase